MPSSGKVAASDGGKEKKSPGKVKSAPLEGKKKLSSLSSFQPTLNFRPSLAAPSSSSSSSTPSPLTPTSKPAQPKPTSTSSGTSMKDRDLMPPPPAGLQTKSKLSTSSFPTSSKGKQREVIVIDSDEEILSPKKPSPKKRVIKNGSHGLSVQKDVVENGIWTEMYAPTNERDLAPGKARIDKVKNWLNEALYGVPLSIGPETKVRSVTADRVRKYRRIMLLTGPAGTGKTATMKVIARDMGVDLIEWGEGVEERSLGSGFERDSPISKLTSWLSRHSYAPLQHSSTSSSSRTTSAPAQTSRKRVLLITSLPTLSHHPTRGAFHQALLSFCSSYTSSSCPLVIIHSDAGLGGKAEESWMERDRGGREGGGEVVGKAVRDGPFCTEIEFIPLAPTFVTRALQRVLDLSDIPQQNKPPKSAIQLISLTSNGDLRSAINSLQFLCGRKAEPVGSKKRKAVDEGDDGTGKVRKISRGVGKGSRGGKGARLDVSEDLRATLDAVTRREQSLGLFHALGKVFYNKRLDDPPNDNDDAEEIEIIRRLPDPDPLPPHLKQFRRSKSRIVMETFIPTIPVDASSFALWIHQSVPSFCQDIEEVSMAFDELCAADIMRTDDDIWQSSPQAITYSLNLTIRGTLLSLPTPVKRSNQKIIKPQFFESFRLERDNNELVDLASGYVTSKSVARSCALEKIAEGGAGGKQELGLAAGFGGILSRVVLASEMIPMMVKIQNLTEVPLLPIKVKPLSMKPYAQLSASNTSEELTAKDTEIDEDGYEESAAGEDGMGLGSGGKGWDLGKEVEDVDEERGELEDDEIRDWD